MVVVPKRPKPKKEVEDAGDAEVADFEEAEVDEWVRLAKLPEDGGGETGNADDEAPGDERGAEPVVDLAAIEENFEGSGADADEGDADAVYVKLAADADGLAFGFKGWGIVDEAGGEEEGHDADGDVDEEDPAPVVVVGDPAAEHGADGGRGDDGDGIEGEGGGSLGGGKGVDEDGLLDGGETAAADALEDASHEHDGERRGDAAEEAGDGEEGDAGHVVVLATEDAGEPGGHGEDDGVGDEIGGENPGDFVVGTAEAAGDVGEGDVGDGGVEELHEGGDGDGEGDDPGIDGEARRSDDGMGGEGRGCRGHGDPCCLKKETEWFLSASDSGKVAGDSLFGGYG